jgi:Ca-activated chloride channel family protein
MIRLPGYALFVVCFAAALGAADQQPVFRGTADLVRVFTTVTDTDARIVTTLQKDDFEVRDEGKPQPITVFDNTPQPIRLVVMLDVSGSMKGSLPLLRQGTDQLFQRLLQGDLARVGTFGRTITISPNFTRKLDELRAGLPTDIDESAPTPLWRGVDEAMDTFKETDNERRVVVILSDGKDSGPTAISLKERWVSQADVIDRARKDDVMVYGIGLRSTGARIPGSGIDGLKSAMLADLPDPGLATVALQTGGGYSEIRYGQDLVEAFAKVADELHSQYLLGFDPPKRDGKSHKLEVRVLQKGMTPRARKSYIAPKE